MRIRACWNFKCIILAIISSLLLILLCSCGDREGAEDGSKSSTKTEQIRSENVSTQTENVSNSDVTLPWIWE